MKIACLILVCLLGISGCQTPSQKRNVAISKAVFAASDSFKQKRFDLAPEYLNEAIRLLPPPTKRDRIVIKPLSGKNKAGVKNDSVGSPTITIGTTEFEKFELENPDIKGILEKEAKDKDKLSNEIGDALRSTIKESDKKEAEPFKFPWFKIFSGLGVVGVIALVVICPAALPIVINIFSSIFGVLSGLFTNFTTTRTPSQ